MNLTQYNAMPEGDNGKVAATTEVLISDMWVECGLKVIPLYAVPQIQQGATK